MFRRPWDGEAIQSQRCYFSPTPVVVYVCLSKGDWVLSDQPKKQNDEEFEWLQSS